MIPMPTEDDLRAALTSLERHAPAAARVLPGLSTRRRSGLRSPLALRWVVGIATTAAVAGAITGLILTGGTSTSAKNGPVALDTPTPSGTKTNGTVTPPAPITKATLQAKLLAAFSATGGEIVYMHGTYQTTGVAHMDPNPATVDTWYYPGQPSTGQQVRARTISIQAGLEHTDVGISYRQSAPTAGPPIGMAQATGERISVDYLAKTWSDVKDAPVMFQPPYNPALIASYFKSKQWTARNTTLNGRAAIELTLKGLVKQGKSTVNSWIEYLWVDASTYLPLHDVITFGPPGEATHAVEDFQYLPASPANLAKLTPPIPAGFKRVIPPSYTPVHQATAEPSPIPTEETLAPSPTTSR
jgi:hypothetical protein